MSANRAPRLKYNGPSTFLHLRIPKSADAALDATIAEINSAFTEIDKHIGVETARKFTKSIMVRRALVVYANQLSALKRDPLALLAELRDASKDTYLNS